MGFKLVVELLFLFNESHHFAVNYAFEGIDRFVGDLVVVQSLCEEDHLDGRFMEVLESIFACLFLFDHVF